MNYRTAKQLSIADANRDEEIDRLNKLLESTLQWHKLPAIVVSQKLEIDRLTAALKAARAALAKVQL